MSNLVSSKALHILTNLITCWSVFMNSKNMSGINLSISVPFFLCLLVRYGAFAP